MRNVKCGGEHKYEECGENVQVRSPTVEASTMWHIKGVVPGEGQRKFNK